MKILLALDPTAYADSEKLVDQGIELAKEKNADLMIMSIAPLIQFSEEQIPSEKVNETLLKMAQETAAKAKSKAAQAGVRAGAVVEASPSPADSIIDYAVAEKVDMVITGSRRKRGLDRFLIGSVASKVVSHAPCSVLVIR